MSDDPHDPSLPESLLPYDTWLENAHRGVVLKALEHLCHHGLPGDHHFYITFLTNYPGVDIPHRLKERYPEEMTIVLQHQFVNPTVDPKKEIFSIGLSFSGVPCALHIPLKAISAFADPYMQLALRFNPDGSSPDLEQDNGSEDDIQKPGELRDFFARNKESPPSSNAEPKDAEIVSLAAFRKRNTDDDTPSQH